MNAVLEWMECRLVPKMNKINGNIFVITLKDSILQTLPFILVGSFLTIVNVFFSFISWLPSTDILIKYSIGLISLFLSFLIPFNYMEKKKKQKMRIIASISGACLFFILSNMKGEELNQLTKLGPEGMFVAMVSGIYVAYVMGKFSDFSLFKEDSYVPDFVRLWFDSLIPILLIMLSGWIPVYLLNIDLYQLIISLFSPIKEFSNTLPGFVFIMFLYAFFYSMGISVWILAPILKPIYLSNIMENMHLVKAGQEAIYITTSEVIFSGWLAIGGVGCTLPLVIMLMFSKSKRLNALGKASFIPGIFNINEPIVFGCIAWTPIMMIPMWLQSIILSPIVYITLHLGAVRIPASVFDMWYCPFPLSTWLVSQDLKGIILFIVILTISSIIWYPFLNLHEKKLSKLETAQ